MLEEPVSLAPSVDAFVDLYERDFRRVTALVFALSGSRSAAEEIAQDAFVAAHRDWAHVSALDDPGGWVRVVALNRARSVWRRRAAEARALARIGARRTLPAELTASTADFWRAVRSLPRAQSIAVALFYGEDRSVADIAQVMGIGEGSVKTHLSRARAALATRLAVDADDSEIGGDDATR